MLIYMNVVIVKTISRSRQMFSKYGSVKSNQKKNDQMDVVNKGLEMRQNAMRSAQNQLTIMLLLVTTLFLILLIPT